MKIQPLDRLEVIYEYDTKQSKHVFKRGIPYAFYVSDISFFKAVDKAKSSLEWLLNKELEYGPWQVHLLSGEYSIKTALKALYMVERV